MLLGGAGVFLAGAALFAWVRARAEAGRADTAERARDLLAQQLDRRMGELFSLQELSFLLAESLQVERIGEQVARYALRFLHADGALVILAEPGGGPLVVAAAEGDVARLAGQVISREAEGAALRAFHGGHIELLDGAAEPVLPGLAARTAAAAPLRAHGVALGVVAVTGHRRGPFTSEDLSLLSTVATHTAVVLANARFVEMVRRGKEEWETAFDALAEGVAVLGADGTIHRANTALARILEHPVEAIVGCPLPDLLRGSEGPVEGLVRTLAAGERGAPLLVRMGQGRLLRLTAAPVAEGRSAAGVVLVEDVTDQRALETQLIQNEKLAAVGQLVSGVAHELNNPLTSIAGLSELLVEQAKAPPEAREHLKVIRDQADRAGRIVRNLLTFARKGSSEERARVDLNDVATRTAQLVAYELRIRGVVLTEALAPAPVEVMGDRYELQSVVLNLLTNAVHAVTVARGDRDRRIVLATATAGGEACLTVSDNGDGVPAGQVPLLFTPFFTTKDPGEGTGLGLSISYGIAEAHGGRLEYAPGAEGGAAFTLRLPAAPAEAPVAPAPRRLLICDDDAKFLRTVRALLAPEAVSVDEAPPGPAGLERLDGGEWDLVLVQGRTEWPGRGPLALALLTDRPALRGRLLAALPPSLPGEAERFRRQGIRVVGLPFDVKELRAAVREAHPAG